MRLEEMKFSAPHDKDIFKALKRTIKDKVFIGESSYWKKKDNEQLVSACYGSRNGHKGEGTFTNYMYWPGDIGIGIDNSILSLIWVSRVVSIIGKDNVTASLKSEITCKINLIISSFNNFRSDREITLFEDNMDVINKAISAIGFGDEKKHAEIMRNILRTDTRNIPF